MMCRMETSFLISFTLVSNNNISTPRILHNQLRVTLTHTSTVPIHNGQNYQELKPRERERERHTHITNSETRIEIKRERKRKNPEGSACYTRVSQQALDLIHCQSKLNQIPLASAQGDEIHHSRVGKRERYKSGVEKIRELEVLLESVKESEKKKKGE